MAQNRITYSHFEHRHNFATWCAFWAVQRGWKGINRPNVTAALEKSGVKEFIEQNGGKNLSQDDFDKQHESWCESIIQSLQKANIEKATYGRAAKLLGVYIKSMVVVQKNQTALGNVAHPPIDSQLLKNISRDRSISHQNRAAWGKYKWTMATKSEYKGLIDDFRQVFNGQPMWNIEKYWTL